jgi:hypothetical protein
MRNLRPMKSPFKDVTGKPIYHGNIVGGMWNNFVIRFRDGVWYRYDATGAYIDPNNRWSELRNDQYHRIVDDQIILLEVQ